MSSDETNGGLGDESGPDLSRSDLRLFERALNDRWPMPRRVRISILQRMVDILDQEPDDEPPLDPNRPSSVRAARRERARAASRLDRKAIAAARVLLAADRLNIAQQLIDLRRGDGGELTAADVVAEAERRALEHRPAGPPKPP